MRLTRLILQVNEYSYEVDGVQPGGYKGQANFEGHDGSMNVKLSQRTVQRILDAIAEESSDKAAEIASKITQSSIVNAASGNILEHYPIPSVPGAAL